MYWYSPIPINNKLKSRLDDLKINQLNEIEKEINEQTLLIYTPPDVILNYIYSEKNIPNFKIKDLIEYYNFFKDLEITSNLKLISGWNLENLSDNEIINIFDYDNLHFKDYKDKIEIPVNNRFICFIALELVKTNKTILDLYKDIELRSTLVKREIDLNIRYRLKENIINFENVILDFFSLNDEIIALKDLMFKNTEEINSLKSKLKDIRFDLQNKEDIYTKLCNDNTLINNYNSKLEDEIESLYIKNLNLEKLSNKQDLLIKKTSEMIGLLSKNNIKKLIKVNDYQNEIILINNKSKFRLFSKIKGILRGN